MPRSRLILFVTDTHKWSPLCIVYLMVLAKMRSHSFLLLTTETFPKSSDLKTIKC